jgi:hypothetical protein
MNFDIRCGLTSLGRGRSNIGTRVNYNDLSATSLEIMVSIGGIISKWP